MTRVVRYIFYIYNQKATGFVSCRRRNFFTFFCIDAVVINTRLGTDEVGSQMVHAQAGEEPTSAPLQTTSSTLSRRTDLRIDYRRRKSPLRHVAEWHSYPACRRHSPRSAATFATRLARSELAVTATRLDGEAADGAF